MDLKPGEWPLIHCMQCSPLMKSSVSWYRKKLHEWHARRSDLQQCEPHSSDVSQVDVPRPDSPTAPSLLFTYPESEGATIPSPVRSYSRTLVRVPRSPSFYMMKGNLVTYIVPQVPIHYPILYTVQPKFTRAAQEERASHLARSLTMPSRIPLTQTCSGSFLNLLWQGLQCLLRTRTWKLRNKRSVQRGAHMDNEHRRKLSRARSTQSILSLLQQVQMSSAHFHEVG